MPTEAPSRRPSIAWRSRCGSSLGETASQVVLLSPRSGPLNELPGTRRRHLLNGARAHGWSVAGGVPSLVHKLLSDANLPKLHLFQSQGEALRAEQRAGASWRG